MLPLASNAVLTKISGDGTAEDYRDPEGADSSVRFDGEAALWVNDKREFVKTDAGGVDRVSERQLVIPPLATPEVGDNVTYSFLGSIRTDEIVALKPMTWDDATLGWRLYLGEV